MAKGELAAMNMMLGDVTDAALGLEADGQRGAFNYNNGNFQIAGMALSRALKKAGRGDYAAFLSKTLWCPLGNADATLWLEHDGGEPRFFAFLDASVRDWARVGQLIAQKGMWNGKQLISPATMEALAAASPGNPNYGMGIWRGSPWTKARRYSREAAFVATHGEAYLADDVLYLDGFGGQRVYIVPSAGLVISRSGETSMTWDDAVLVNEALRGMGAVSAKP
jgi:CubicO group peptidase (beta-lactamase class C family)